MRFKSIFLGSENKSFYRAKFLLCKSSKGQNYMSNVKQQQGEKNPKAKSQKKNHFIILKRHIHLRF